MATFNLGPRCKRMQVVVVGGRGRGRDRGGAWRGSGEGGNLEGQWPKLHCFQAHTGHAWVGHGRSS